MRSTYWNIWEKQEGKLANIAATTNIEDRIHWILMSQLAKIQRKHHDKLMKCWLPPVGSDLLVVHANVKPLHYVCTRYISITLSLCQLCFFVLCGLRFILKNSWNFGLKEKIIWGWSKAEFANLNIMFFPLEDLPGPPLCFLQPRWRRLQPYPAHLSPRQRWMARSFPRSARQRNDASTGWRWRAAGGHRIARTKPGNHHWPHCGDAGKHLPLWNQQELPG